MNNTMIGLTILLIIYIIIFEIHKRKAGKRTEIREKMENEEKLKKVEELREKFKNNLIGHWVSCSGSFDMIMNEEWVFKTDGTGFFISRSLSTGEGKKEFFWRKNSVRCIDMKWGDGVWIPTNYDFCLTATEFGCFPTLVEFKSDNKLSNGFGIFEIPLTYSSEET